MIRSHVRRLFLLLATTGMAPLSAQLIPVRTVPVASGDQFLSRPSATAAMGGISLALDDSIADPWVNPAKGVFLKEPSFFSAPTYYGISGRGGAGRTFPVGGIFKGGAWFGGATLALQQIDNDDGGSVFIQPWVDSFGPPRRLGDVSSRNLYAATFVGRPLGHGGWSAGLGLSGARLDAMDGVDLLYAGADRIDQSGSTADVRLGLFRSGERDRLSLVLLHNRVSMTHDVSYVDWFWDDETQQPLVVSRLVINEDQTRTYGGQVEWDRDLRAPGWRFGASATLNRKSHPKIPNYEIQNIPRDPGTTWAYETAFGISRARDGTTFGLDVVLQPIWSNTWQESDTTLVVPNGHTFKPGDRTIENDFFFTNVMLRTGMSHQIRDVGLQAGLEVRSYDYGLEQIDHTTGAYREQDESWMEWSPSLGASFRFADLELRYLGRLTTGTGRPGTQWDASRGGVLEAAADFIIAPQAPLTLQDATVTTHQISVSIPIR